MTNQIDPVQGLVDYTLNVKPFHSKIIEVLVDYIHNDLVGVTVVDTMNFKLSVDANYTPLYCTTAGYGIGPYGDYYTAGQSPIQFNILSINTTTNVFTVGGDFRPFVNVGNSISVRNSTTHINGEWAVSSISFDAITHITTMDVSHVMGGTTDGIITSASAATYPIVRVDVTNKLFVINSNFSSDFSVGDIISVGDSSDNDGNWLVTSVFYHLLEDTTILGVEFDSMTSLVAPADGNITVYTQSNFDLPEECPSISPNMARATFAEELDFILGDTLWFRDYINVDILEPSGIVPWSGEIYGWDIAGYNTEWPSFITMVENMTDVVGVNVLDAVDVGDLVAIPNMGQYAIDDIGWDASMWDSGLGVEWDPDFAPEVELQSVQTAITDTMQIVGDLANAFDYPYFDVGTFD